MLFACAGPLSIEIEGGEGSVPAALSFTAITDEEASVEWTLDDEALGSGTELTYTFLGSGSFEIVATATLKGKTATATATVDISPASCPSAGEPVTAGQVTDPDQTEISGVAVSQAWPGVLWVIEDAGNPSELVAIDSTGEVLAIFGLPDTTARDWEDLALSPDGILYLADIGDNEPLDRPEVVIAMVAEPDPYAGDRDLESSELGISYEDGLHDAESMAFDPVTGDLWIATKNHEGPTEIFKKAAPHVAGSSTVLAPQLVLDFTVAPLSGGATTGAAFSPLGDLLAIRTYQNTAWLFRIDRSLGIVAGLEGDPCPFALPAEPQGESISFDPSGEGVWTVSEQAEPLVHYTPLIR